MAGIAKLVGVAAGAIVLAAAALLGAGPILRGLGLDGELGGLSAEPARATFAGVGKAPARVPVPDEVLVRFEPGTDAEERTAARDDVDAELEESLPLPRLQQLSLEGDASVRDAVDELEADDAVAYAEPNFYRRAAATGDPFFRYLWGLENTGQEVAGMAGSDDADADVPEAWATTTGSPGITTAVIDTGVDVGHTDLASKIWRNPGESGNGRESNGVDDDRNGLVDDWRGWDWVADDGTPSDPNGHGTHVAGTIAARADDRGVVGVNRGGTVMALRVLDREGYGTVADLVEGYRYAGRKGAEIVNASLGGASFSRAEYDAIKAAPGTLFAVAAGNGGWDGVGDDNDSAPQYPCAYSLDNIVCVAATNQHDRLASFSNHGLESVDLAAPGTNILSDLPGSRYGYFNGTSMATPHVAGAAGLVWAANPGATVADVKGALMEGAEPVEGLVGATVTGGRLSAAAAVAPGAAPPSDGSESVEKDPPADRKAPVARAPEHTLVRGARVRPPLPLRLRWSGTDDTTRPAHLSYDLQRRSGGTWRRLASSVSRTTAKDSVPLGGSHRFRVRARDEAGNVGAWAVGRALAPRALQESHPGVVYGGRWKHRRERSALGGAVRTSARARARATLGFRGRSVGLVMPRRDGLGTARVCVDPGTSRQACATVNLDPSNGLGPRAVVFARDRLDPSARHTIRVQVVRGRVDLDAFVVLR